MLPAARKSTGQDPSSTRSPADLMLDGPCTHGHQTIEYLPLHALLTPFQMPSLISFPHPHQPLGSRPSRDTIPALDVGDDPPPSTIPCTRDHGHASPPLQSPSPIPPLPVLVYDSLVRPCIYPHTNGSPSPHPACPALAHMYYCFPGKRGKAAPTNHMYLSGLQSCLLELVAAAETHAPQRSYSLPNQAALRGSGMAPIDDEGMDTGGGGLASLLANVV